MILFFHSRSRLPQILAALFCMFSAACSSLSAVPAPRGQIVESSNTELCKASLSADSRSVLLEISEGQCSRSCRVYGIPYSTADILSISRWSGNCSIEFVGTFREMYLSPFVDARVVAQSLTSSASQLRDLQCLTTHFDVIEQILSLISGDPASVKPAFLESLQSLCVRRVEHVKLNSLVAFAQFLPKLQHLELELSGTGNLYENDLLELRSLPTSLRELHISETGLAAELTILTSPPSEHLVRVLSSLPNVRVVSVWAAGKVDLFPILNSRELPIQIELRWVIPEFEGRSFPWSLERFTYRPINAECALVAIKYLQSVPKPRLRGNQLPHSWEVIYHDSDG